MTLRTALLGTLFTAALSAAAFAQGASPPAATPPATGNTARQPSAAQLAQQERMRTCNAEAGTRTLTGDARRTFMSECLAGRMPPAAQPAPAARQPSAAQQGQQDRMRSCNATAGQRNLTGAARQTFMTECLAGR